MSDSEESQNAFDTIAQQIEQYRIRSSRIVTVPGYEPQEVWIVWETLDHPHSRRHITSRGLLSRKKQWMLLSTELERNWKHMTYVMSDDSELSAFVSESIELGHLRDVIQIDSIKYNEPLFNIVLDRNELHGPVYVSGQHSHFKFSSPHCRKLLYFARPTKEQLETKNQKERIFVICVYDFETRGITVIDEEKICEKPINAIEWTPDCRGVVIHRDTDLLCHRFGEQYVNVIYQKCPAPLKITFSPMENRLAVFLPTSYNSENSILLFHWPFVKAAVQYLHDVVSLGDHRVWSVPERPWANGGKSLVFNANWQLNVISYSVEVESRVLEKFTFPYPAMVIDVQGNEMLFETLSANSQTRLWISSLSSATKQTEFTASLLASQRPMHTKAHNFEISHHYFGNDTYTGILYMIKRKYMKRNKLPLIVVPYAGDKPNFTQLIIDPVYTTFVNCGYCVLVVNNRKPFSALPNGFPKQLDTNVTDDVHNAVLQTLNEESRIDKKSIYLYGVGYGSFVAGTLIIKYPDYYDSAAMVKPLLEYPNGMLVTEMGEKYLNEFQPLTNTHKIKTPIILVSEKKEDRMYGQFQEALWENMVPCTEVFEEDDDDPNDYLVKIIQFYECPPGISE